MCRLLWILSAFALIVFIFSGSGCGKCETCPPQGQAAASETDDVEANLAQLSPEDRALAEKQQTCPVSGETLGEMGVPEKITIKERTVFLCCPGCKEAIEKNPDKYLAKLPK